MAGRTYPTMEDTERRLPWSATMPNLEYSSTYSGHHSDITAESHLALTTAYDDLKKRYNDIQSKLTQTAKQLRDVQRRGSSPDLAGATGSPRHLAAGRARAPPPLEEEPGADGGDVALLGRERDMLARQVSELEHRLAEAKNQLADSEHETRQLRGHVSRQEDDLRQNQRHLMRTEGENEDMRKRLTLLKRQLRSTDADKARAGDVDRQAVGSAGSQSNSLSSSSLDTAPMSASAGRAMAAGSADSAFNTELQAVLMSAMATQEEMKEMRATVQKQRDVILMLVNRQTTEQRESLQKKAELQRQSETVTCGIGARPKIRPCDTAGSALAGNMPGTERPHLMQPVVCTEDLQVLAGRSHDRPNHRASARQLVSQARQSAEVRQGVEIRQSGELPSSADVRQTPAEVLTTPVSMSAKPGALNSENVQGTPEHELELHYDDLQFGGGVDVAWEGGGGGARASTNTADIEPLLPSPTGQLGKRNESMEHLHDDSEPYDLVEELESTTSGSTLCGTDDAEAEYEECGYQQLSGPESNTEPHFQNAGSPLQQRSLNMERSEYRPPGSLTRNYDNAKANGNVNMPSLDNKFATGGIMTKTKTEQPFMNNAPQSRTHTGINSRNLYPGGGAPARHTSPEPTPPPRRVGRTPVEQASGEEPTTPELRHCPVCMDDFPSHLAMEEFQQHVLDCTGRTERICPMCDATFPDEVLQTEFERHVNEHFEDDTTLQFEVMSSTTS